MHGLTGARLEVGGTARVKTGGLGATAAAACEGCEAVVQCFSVCGLWVMKSIQWVKKHF